VEIQSPEMRRNYLTRLWIYAYEYNVKHQRSVSVTGVKPQLLRVTRKSARRRCIFILLSWFIIYVFLCKISQIDSYSAFYDNGKVTSTDLHRILSERDVKTVFLVGVATDYCVYYSAKDAVSLGQFT
jgi:preprotein translocase subunit Sec63